MSSEIKVVECLEETRKTMVELFRDYAKEEGKKHKLSEDELKKMLEEEMSSELRDELKEDMEKAKEKLKKIRNDRKKRKNKPEKAGGNGDEFGFPMFGRLVSILAKALYKKPEDTECKKSDKRVDQIITKIVVLFRKYAEGEGDDCQINIENFLKEIEGSGIAELSEEDIKQALERVDRDDNGKVRIQEFGRFVGVLAKFCFRAKGGKGGRGRRRGSKSDTE